MLGIINLSNEKLTAFIEIYQNKFSASDTTIGYQEESYLKNAVFFDNIYNKVFKSQMKIFTKSEYENNFKYLENYFNQYIYNLISEKLEINKIQLANHFKYLANIFKQVAEGKMSLFFNMFANYYLGYFEKSIEKFSIAIKTIEAAKMPSYFNKRNFDIANIFIINYISQIEKTLSLNAGSKLINDSLQKIPPILNNFYKLYKAERIIKEKPLSEYLIHVYSGQVYKDINLRTLPLDLQISLLVRKKYYSDDITKFLLKWSVDYNNSQSINENLNKQLKSFHNIFKESNNVLITNELSLIIEKNIFFLNNYDYYDYDEKIFGENSDLLLKNNIFKLMSFIKSKYSKIKNIYTIYQTVLLIIKTKNYFDDFYQKDFLTKLSKYLIELLHQYYQNIPLYHWHFIDRNILDEMNVLLEKISIEQYNFN